MKKFFKRLQKDLRLQLVLSVVAFALLTVFFTSIYSEKKGAEDISVAQTASSWDYSIVGNPNFDENQLPAKAKYWYTKLWQSINYSGKYPDPYNAASSGDCYKIGRVLGPYIYALSNTMRVSGDLRLLDEMTNVMDIARPKLVDIDGDGNRHWLFLFEPEKGSSLYGTENHLMDNMLSITAVATYTYALKENIGLRPQYQERLNFWKQIMLEYEAGQFRNGSYPNKTLMHPYSGFATYWVFAYKIFGDSWRRTQYESRINKMEDMMVYYAPKGETGVFWDHRVLGLDGSSPWGCQPVYYATLSMQFMLNLHWEHIGDFANQSFMRNLAVMTRDSYLKNGYKVIPGDICDGWNVPGLKSSGYNNFDENRFQVLGGYHFMAAWDNTDTLGDMYEDAYKSHSNLLSNYSIPAGMFLYEMSKTTPDDDLTYCGDGVIQNPNDEGINEVCDDGNTSNNDQCSADCLHICPSGSSWNGSICVTPPECGNNIKETGEECDDGNTNNGDGCSSTCTIEVPPPVCGNGIKEGTEECDDGNLTSGDGCSSECSLENVPDPICGNGTVETGESCDDGNSTNYDQCSYNCLNSCISPQIWNTFACVSPNICGNGIVDTGEECDDGNTTDGDGCQSDCKYPLIPPEDIVCGNGVVEAGEACDDGNVNNFDACSSDCQNLCPAAQIWDGYKCFRPNVCGNTYLELYEVCDDGNTSNGDYCSSDCRNSCINPEVWNYDICYIPNICGNGVLETGEECDDGNAVNIDTCDTSCKLVVSSQYCGDGIINLNEVCDDGSRANGDQCSDDCMHSCVAPEIWDGYICIDLNSGNKEDNVISYSSNTIPYIPNDGDNQETGTNTLVEEEVISKEEDADIEALPTTTEEYDSVVKRNLFDDILTLWCCIGSMALAGSFIAVAGFVYYKRKRIESNENSKN